MLKVIYRSLVATLVLAFVLCGVYPAIITLVGRALFSSQVNGGMIYKDGKVIGAKLIGQAFTRAEYFHGRPSAAGNGYDAANSSGSNFGPTHQKFHDALKSNIENVLKENPELKVGEVPTEMVTISASGLDPHISPLAALAQVGRVSKARGINVEQLKSLVQTHTNGPQLGILGESVINVLTLNLELDQRFPLISKK